MINRQTPLVSIRLLSYNHAPFLRKAIEGVLLQETNFPIEVVIGDDFSIDDSLAILNDYKSTAQIDVRILERTTGDAYDVKRKQLGRLHNFQSTIEQCVGKYIALLDGDDYWDDPQKLQKQVDYLEAHPEVVISFHNVVLVDEKDNLIDTDFLKTNTTHYNANDLVAGAILPVCSVVYRNVVEFPTNFTKVENGDTFLFALLAKYGTAYLHPELKANYRIHDGGVYSKKPLVVKKSRSLTTFRELKKVIHKTFIPTVNRTLATTCWALARHSKSLKQQFSYGLASIYYVVLFGISKYLNIKV